MKVGTRAAALAAALVVLSVATARAELTQAKVLGGKPDQVTPAYNGTYLLWSANSGRHPSGYAVYAKNTAGKVTRVSPSGYASFLGSINATSTEVFYQRVNLETGDSNVAAYELSTGTPLVVPAGFNTKLFEWLPFATDTFVEFGRDDSRKPTAPSKVVLYDRTADRFRILDDVPHRCYCIAPGTVSTAYALWTKCAGGTCQVWYYDLANHTTARIPNPDGKQQYGAVYSDLTSNFYFVRSGNGCGANVQVMRWKIGDPAATVVSSLPANADVPSRLYVYSNGTNDDLYFDRHSCSGNGYSDIYEVSQADTAV